MMMKMKMSLSGGIKGQRESEDTMDDGGDEPAVMTMTPIVGGVTTQPWRQGQQSAAEEAGERRRR